MVGQKIRQYRVIDRLGHGGMGAVYCAIDDMLEREVALKVLAAEFDGHEQRFRAEAVSLARLRHPGIATIHELFEHDGQWVMVMELVRGQTLEQIMEQSGVLSPQRGGEYCMQALTALAHAHAAGIVHRDLKPSNLMIAEGGVLKILDFGIARLEGSVHLTHAGFMMGTPAYMAPEQVQSEDVDHRADLYAIGVIFYRLVTGALPFNGETAFAMAQSQVNDSPTPIEQIRADLPAWVPAIVNRALAKDPGERFQSAAEFHDSLGRALAGLPLSMTAGAGAPTEVMIRPPSMTPVAALRHELPSSPSSEPPVDSTGAPPGPGPGGERRTGRTIALALQRPPRAVWIGVACAGVFVGVWRSIPTHAPEASGAGTPTAVVATPSPAPVNTAKPRTSRAANARVATAGVVNADRGTPGRPAATGSTPAPAIFTNVKLLVVHGARTEERDVLLSFSDRQITALPNGGQAPIAIVPYPRVAKATYVHASDPRWDSLLAAPAGRIDVPGIFGKNRHWLVVQTKDTYAIFRLDGNDWSKVLDTFQAQTGITIDRPLVTGR